MLVLYLVVFFLSAGQSTLANSPILYRIPIFGPAGSRTIYSCDLQNVSMRLVFLWLHRYVHTLHIRWPNGIAPHHYRRPSLSRYEIYVLIIYQGHPMTVYSWAI